MVLIAARLAAETGDWELPASVGRALADDPRSETIARQYAAAPDIDHDADWQPLRRLFGRRHAWDTPLLQARWLARLVLTPNPQDYGWIPLPDPLGVVTYLVRPVRLAWQWLLLPVVGQIKRR
jgi:hypothetical protein